MIYTPKLLKIINYEIYLYFTSYMKISPLKFLNKCIIQSLMFARYTPIDSLLLNASNLIIYGENCKINSRCWAVVLYMWWWWWNRGRWILQPMLLETSWCFARPHLTASPIRKRQKEKEENIPIFGCLVKQVWDNFWFQFYW